MSAPAPTTIAAVLVDLDDTLVPWQTVSHWQWAWRPRGPILSERHVHAALKRSLHRWDRRRWEGLTGGAPPVDDAAYRGFLAWTLGEIAGHALAAEETKAVVDRFLRPAHEAERFPDALPALAELRKRNLPFGVVTGLPADASRIALRRAGLEESLLLPTEAGAPTVPAPAAYKAAVARLGAKPRSTLFIGDLFWSDVRSAARAGLVSVLIDRMDAAGRITGPRIRSLAELGPLLDRPPEAGEPASSAGGPDGPPAPPPGSLAD